MQMANRHMRRCPASPITREMQIKTIVRHHCIPILRTVVIVMMMMMMMVVVVVMVIVMMCWLEWGKSELWCTAGGNVKWCSHC